MKSNSYKKRNDYRSINCNDKRNTIKGIFNNKQNNSTLKNINKMLIIVSQSLRKVKIKSPINNYYEKLLFYK